MDYTKLAKEILDGNYIAGVRSLCADEQYNVGDECRDSYEWDVENDCSTYHTTGERSGGTCATQIDTHGFTTDDWVSELANRIADAVEANKIYSGNNGAQAIIVGHRVNNDGYFDPGEIRIIDAEVLAIV